MTCVMHMSRFVQVYHLILPTWPSCCNGMSYMVKEVPAEKLLWAISCRASQIPESSFILCIPFHLLRCGVALKWVFVGLFLFFCASVEQRCLHSWKLPPCILCTAQFRYLIELVCSVSFKEMLLSRVRLSCIFIFALLSFIPMWVLYQQLFLDVTKILWLSSLVITSLTSFTCEILQRDWSIHCLCDYCILPMRRTVLKELNSWHYWAQSLMICIDAMVVVPICYLDSASRNGLPCGSLFWPNWTVCRMREMVWLDKKFEVHLFQIHWSIYIAPFWNCLSCDEHFVHSSMGAFLEGENPCEVARVICEFLLFATATKNCGMQEMKRNRF